MEAEDRVSMAKLVKGIQIDVVEEVEVKVEAEEEARLSIRYVVNLVIL